MKGSSKPERQAVAEWSQSNKSYIDMIQYEKQGTTRDMCVSAYAGILVFSLFIGGLFVTQSCQTSAIQRVFQAQKTIVLFADGGDIAYGEPNTREAFMAALNYTRHLKVYVYKMAVASEAGRYFIYKSRLADLDTQSENERTCYLHQIAPGGNSTRIFWIEDMFAFARAYNATLLLQFRPCVHNRTGDLIDRLPDGFKKRERTLRRAKKVADAIFELDYIAGVQGLRATQTLFAIESHDTVTVLTDASRFHYTRFIVQKSAVDSVMSPFVEAEFALASHLGGVITNSTSSPNLTRLYSPLALSVDLFAYDMWTCQTHMSVYQHTWLHARNAGAHAIRILKYGAVRSIETEQVSLVFADAVACNVSVL